VFFSQWTYRRQGFSGTQRAGSRHGFDLIHDLQVYGFSGFEIDVKSHDLYLS
jgi:hypothetical protein